MAGGATSRDLKRAPRPDPPRPLRATPAMHLVPVRASSAPTVPTVRAVPNVELGSEHLVSLPDDTEVRIRRLIAEELALREAASGSRSAVPAGRGYGPLPASRRSCAGLRLVVV